MARAARNALARQPLNLPRLQLKPAHLTRNNGLTVVHPSVAGATGSTRKTRSKALKAGARDSQGRRSDWARSPYLEPRLTAVTNDSRWSA